MIFPAVSGMILFQPCLVWTVIYVEVGPIKVLENSQAFDLQWMGATSTVQYST